MKECSACYRYSVGSSDWCEVHLREIMSDELVDDLAREIYVEYLVQNKKKLK